MKAGIYIIISPSARVYIGQSVDIERRFKTYKYLDCKGQARLYRSFEKYGVDKHFFEIMESCDDSILNERERYWQDKYDVLSEYGMNCRLTDTNDKSGKCNSEAIKEAGKRRSERAIEKAIKAADELRKKGKPVTKLGVAKTSGLSRSTVIIHWDRINVS